MGFALLIIFPRHGHVFVPDIFWYLLFFVQGRLVDRICFLIYSLISPFCIGLMVVFVFSFFISPFSYLLFPVILSLAFIFLFSRFQESLS